MTEAGLHSPFAPLASLSALVRGPGGYFARQTHSRDDVIRVGAWIGLIEAQALNEEHYERLLADCVFPAVQKRAFDFFIGNYEHAHAKRSIAASGQSSDADVQQDLMLAEVENKPESIVEAQRNLYLSTGAGLHLVAIARPAEQAWGPLASLDWAVRAFAAQPFNSSLMLQILQMLADQGNAKHTSELARQLAASPVHRPVSIVVSALGQRQYGAFADALKTLDQAQADPALHEPLAQFQGFVQMLRADLLRKLGQHRKSFEVTTRLNSIVASKEGADKTAFYKSLESLRTFDIAARNNGVRPNYIQTIGFPRSGTSELVEALTLHPEIDVVDDARGIEAMVASIERLKSDNNGSSDPAELGSDLQRRYYAEIDRRRRLPDAAVCIDAAPLQLAYATLLHKVLPSQKSIFIVREPFDVVLSCFQHRFAPNDVTASFHTIPDAAQLYHFAMTEWFSKHGLDDEAVYYVRYDELGSIDGAIADGLGRFLGVGLTDGVRASMRAWSERRNLAGIAAGASREADWRNFEFAFPNDARKLLRKWSVFLGFETK